MRVRIATAHPVSTRARALVATALALLALAVGAPTTAAGAGDYWARCGDQPELGAGWYKVRAHKVGCKKARRVARQYWTHGGDRRFDDWRCRHRRVGHELSIADCKRFHRDRFQRVKFEFGA